MPHPGIDNRRRDAVRLRRQRAQRIGIDTVGSLAVDKAGLVQHQPYLWKIAEVGAESVVAEGVEIAVTLTEPVVELDAQLECRPGAPHECAFVDLQHVVELADPLHGRFTDADGRDVVRFDEPDLDLGGEESGQRRCGHPAGSAATDNGDFREWCCAHDSSLPARNGNGGARLIPVFLFQR